jgi:hypothetical protein
MPIKGQILPDHMPVNKFQLSIAGLSLPILFTEISGLEQELETVDLPDRTSASGGTTKITEFTAKQPAHHALDIATLEAWFLEAKLGSPTYKKPCTLVIFSLSGLFLRSYTLIGMYPSKRKSPDLDMKNEGEMAEVEWTFKVDDVLPV